MGGRTDGPGGRTCGCDAPGAAKKRERCQTRGRASKQASGGRATSLGGGEGRKHVAYGSKYLPTCPLLGIGATWLWGVDRCPVSAPGEQKQTFNACRHGLCWGPMGGGQPVAVVVDFKVHRQRGGLSARLPFRPSAGAGLRASLHLSATCLLRTEYSRLQKTAGDVPGKAPKLGSLLRPRPGAMHGNARSNV